MLSRELEVTLNLAFKDARKKRHELMSVEHLLLALLDNNSAVNVLNACGADIEKLRSELEEFLDATTPLIPQNETERETQPTLGFQRVLQRAVFHVQSSGKKEVDGANVLVAIFSEQESHAVFLLKQQTCSASTSSTISPMASPRAAMTWNVPVTPKAWQRRRRRREASQCARVLCHQFE